MKNNKYIIKKMQSGISLPLTIILTLASSGVLVAYFETLYEQEWHTRYRIAVAKAEYNASYGITQIYEELYSKERENILPGEELGEGTIPFKKQWKTKGIMGKYKATGQDSIDISSYQKIRLGFSIGIAEVEHLLNNKKIIIERDKTLILGREGSLSDFLYLTNDERAGGAPWSYSPGSTTERGPVSFGAGDQMNQQWQGDIVCDVGFQTNGTFVMSQFGAPQFDITVSITEDEHGVHSPNMNGQNPNVVFQGDPPLDTLDCVKLPPDDYEENKTLIENSPDHLTIDATQKLKWQPFMNARDTLIMTDIEFFVEGDNHGIKVKQWWFLKPPYISNYLGVDSPFVASPFAMGETAADCSPLMTNPTSFDIRGCESYIESMERFHCRTVSPVNGGDLLIDNLSQTVRGPLGFQFYDFPDIYASGTYNNGPPSNFNNNWTSQFEIDTVAPFNIPDHLLPEYVATGGSRTYLYEHPLAIYVKGGPVRVHGTYRGRYTIYTDENTPYHRHAWGINVAGANPIDTLWNNIWLIDDIVNDDADGNQNLFIAQPDEDMVGGSDNALGLISGANVYIANTRANGAQDGGSTNCNDNFCDINIHAHIVAFNEAFAVQYWQNTHTGGGNQFTTPPKGDGQGTQAFNGTGSDDNRGTINLWGGLVQKNRGYVVRNSPGSFINNFAGNIGYPSKNYNFDCNLKKAAPPLFPTIETCTEDEDEINWVTTGYY